jgi:hypothetical protein
MSKRIAKAEVLKMKKLYRTVKYIASYRNRTRLSQEEEGKRVHEWNKAYMHSYTTYGKHRIKGRLSPTEGHTVRLLQVHRLHGSSDSPVFAPVTNKNHDRRVEKTLNLFVHILFCSLPSHSKFKR